MRRLALMAFVLLSVSTHGVAGIRGTSPVLMSEVSEKYPFDYTTVLNSTGTHFITVTVDWYSGQHAKYSIQLRDAAGRLIAVHDAGIAFKRVIFTRDGLRYYVSSSFGKVDAYDLRGNLVLSYCENTSCDVQNGDHFPQRPGFQMSPDGAMILSYTYAEFLTVRNLAGELILSAKGLNKSLGLGLIDEAFFSGDSRRLIVNYRTVGAPHGHQTPVVYDLSGNQLFQLKDDAVAVAKETDEIVGAKTVRFDNDELGSRISIYSPAGVLTSAFITQSQHAISDLRFSSDGTKIFATADFGDRFVVYDRGGRVLVQPSDLKGASRPMLSAFGDKLFYVGASGVCSWNFSTQQSTPLFSNTDDQKFKSGYYLSDNEEFLLGTAFRKSDGSYFARFWQL